jgi:hypothetical protein
MTRMTAVRYVTLAALVVWLGGMVTLGLLTTPSADQLSQFQTVGYVCGAIVFVCLVVIKFVGPPPHDFFTRIGLVAGMLAVALYSSVRPQGSQIAMTINIAIGSVLLFWYTRE